MCKMTVSQELARMSVQIKLQDLDPESLHLLKRFVLDYLGNALAGSMVDSSQTLTRAVLQYHFEKSECTVIGKTQKLSVCSAAMLNGGYGHAIELDDDHREAILHPGVAVIPAALAVAEMQHKSGEEFLEAVLAGYEVMVRVGAGLLGKAMYSGWHLTGVCGVFGAAVAAGRLLDLQEERLADALGIAGSTSSGLFEYKTNGSWTKRFHPGKAAMSGIIAALLAKEGYTGPATIFEGDNGFYKAYSHQGAYSLETTLQDLGKKYISLETSIKTAACCRFCQPVVDCAMDLAVRCNIDPAEITDILVKADKFAIDLLTKPADRVFTPQTIVDAQFSIPYAVAVSIVRKKALLEEFNEKAIRDPAILAVASKVRWEEDPSYEEKYPKCYPSSVTVWTNGGKLYQSSIEYPKGDPENPVTDEELIVKFRALAEYALSRSDQIEEIVKTVFSLEELNIKQLAELLY